jgi:D-xylose transport system permease protein
MSAMTPNESLPVQNPQPEPPSVEVNRPTTTGGQSERSVSIRDFSMLIALIAICVYFTYMTGSAFVGARNLSMLAIELSITAVLALGMLLIILPGHIDLSVGSGVGLTGGIAAVLVINGLTWERGPGDIVALTGPWPAWAAALTAFAVGVGIWFLMGALIIRQRIPAFIITLGGLLVFRGMHWWVIRNTTVPIVAGGEQNIISVLTTFYLPPLYSLALAGAITVAMGWGMLADYRARKGQAGVPVDGEYDFMRWFISSQLLLLFVLVCNQYQGVPLSAIILGVVAFAIYVLTQHTVFGRYLYAIGGNEEAAFVSGVPVQRIVIGAFVIMGAIVALTGLLQSAYAGASTTTVGELMELDAVAACVIGGTSLKGGRGTVGGVLIGSLVMAALLNGMTLMAVSPEMRYIARGGVLALAVWMDVKLARK